MREKLEKQLKKEKEMREIRTINESTKQKVESGQSKIKPIKFGKQSGTTYCFGYKDYTKNFRPQKVKMINKVLREKSHCVVCQSNKSRFLKQKIN